MLLLWGNAGVFCGYPAIRRHSKRPRTPVVLSAIFGVGDKPENLFSANGEYPGPVSNHERNIHSDIHSFFCAREIGKRDGEVLIHSYSVRVPRARPYLGDKIRDKAAVKFLTSRNDLSNAKPHVHIIERYESVIGDLE